jgi:MFS family permease
MPRQLAGNSSVAESHASGVWMRTREQLGMFTTRKFWTIAGAVALVFSVSQAVLVSLVPHVLDIGMSPVTASTLVSTVALSSMFGKLLFGFFLDRLAKKWILGLVILLVIIQIVVLLLADNYWVLLVLLFLTGLAVGGELPVWAATVGDYFQSANIGWVMGAMNLINMLSNMLVIYWVGVLYDRSDSYLSSFSLLICFLLLAFILCCSIPRLRHE